MRRSHKCIGVAALVMVLVLAACGVREIRPTDMDMDRVDAALQAEPCVGELVDWHRTYYFHAKYFGDEVAKAAKEGRAPRASGHVRHILGFELSRTQPGGAQRLSLAQPPLGPELEAKSEQAQAAAGKPADVRRAAGTYNLRTDELDLAHCDPDHEDDAAR